MGPDLDGCLKESLVKGSSIVVKTSITAVVINIAAGVAVFAATKLDPLNAAISLVMAAIVVGLGRLTGPKVPTGPKASHYWREICDSIADTMGSGPVRLIFLGGGEKSARMGSYLSACIDTQGPVAILRVGGELREVLADDELKFVIAHEIAHNVHIKAKWFQLSKITPGFRLVTPALLLMALLSGRSSMEAFWLTAIGFLLDVLFTARFSRKGELMADEAAAIMIGADAGVRALNALTMIKVKNPNMPMKNPDDQGEVSPEEALRSEGVFKKSSQKRGGGKGRAWVLPVEFHPSLQVRKDRLKKFESIRVKRQG